MNPSVICYPTPGKDKARHVCEAFARGCAGMVFQSGAPIAVEGAAFFFGVPQPLRPVWQMVRACGNDYYYGDNAYFDHLRERYYRVTKNALQVSARAEPDYKRLEQQSVEIKRWRDDGAHVLLLQQSADFMDFVGQRGWLGWVVSELQKHTKREIRVRAWNRDKRKASATFLEDLRDCWCVVTHMSAAANTAILQGIPAVVTGPCAASPLAGSKLEEVIDPPRLADDARYHWAAGLAANHWTLDEMRSGLAWEKLNGMG